MTYPAKSRVLSTLGVLCLVALALGISCSSPEEESSLSSEGGTAGSVIYFGQVSLEETIADADVTARVRLRSVTTGIERWDGQRWDEEVLDIPNVDPVRYVGTLEHRFEVLEYLYGTGDDTIVAVVNEDSAGHTSTGDAAEVASGLLDRRDTSWDHGEAIVFLYELSDGHALMLDFPKEGYYSLGSVQTDHGDFYGDNYSIASIHSKQWLPEAPGALGASSSRSSGTKRFLLDVPSSSGGSRASGASDLSTTITLASLKAKIGEFDQEVAAGGGSQAYRECLYAKARAERRVEERTQGFKRPLFTHHKSVGSGLPAGTLLYPDDFTGDRTPRPPSRRVMEIRGEDADLFVAHNSEVVDTARPLPAGEYRFYEEWIDTNLIPCDGEPEEMDRDVDIIVTVTAPEGVVHEALFDPVSSGDSTGYHGTGDALSDTDFTLADGTEISIESLVHESERLTLGLSPFNALTGHTLDFITVDGTSALTLNASAAAVNAEYGTLTWAVSDGPWSQGDKLMLRISEPEPLRAEFRRAPHSHNGRTAFTIRLRFNAPVAGLDATTVQSALEVENGRITRARTVNPDQTHLWELRVQPARGGLLTITLPSSKNCTSTPVICDGGERPVSEAVILRVQGSVRDE